MSHSSESGSNEVSQNNSSSGSSGQASTDSDSSGSGLGCGESIGSDSPPCRNHTFNNKNTAINCNQSSGSRLGLENSTTPQVVVTRAVININPQVIYYFFSKCTFMNLNFLSNTW